MSGAEIGKIATLRPYLRQYAGRYAAGFACLITVDAAQIFMPQIVRRAVDRFVSGDFVLAEIWPLAGALAATAASIALGRFLWRFFIHGASRRIETALRDRLFAHLMRLGPEFFQANRTGDLMSRATSDLNAVRTAIGMGLVALIDGTVMAVGILVAMLVQNPGIALVTIIPLPAITLLMLGFGRLVGKYHKQAQEAYGTLSELAKETFAGIRVVKSFAQEDWFRGRFAAANDAYRAANMRAVRVQGSFFPLIAWLSGITILLLLAAGGPAVIAGELSPGSFVALLSYLQMMIWPLMGAGFTINMLQRGAVSLGRIDDLLAVPPSIAPPAAPKPRRNRPRGAPLIEARGVGFAYPGGPPRLAGIDFKVGRGSALGILGRTGSGKSTLLALLPRLFDPTEGELLIDGVATRDWDLTALRRLFGTAPQDAFLFSDTIRANVAYADPALSDAAVADAIRAAALDGDLVRFPEGEATVIGERGLSLSGGQKQRTAIARALAAAPEILVLDDALSAVDSSTEERLLDGILSERGLRTVVFVSHRVSALSRADHVLVLEDGRIAEAGAPEVLAGGDGFYAEIARLQRLEKADAPPGEA
jgi:ATP-binding cassette subfamily B protein